MTDGQDSSAPALPGPRRLAAGAGAGAVATLAMSAVMLTTVLTGASPMPKPVPAALVAHTLGPLPEPASIVLAALTHLAYGAIAGAVLAGSLRRVTLGKALGYGAGLWALMGLAWLPYLGWGAFGTALTVKIAVATLLLHLIYGAVLGLLLDRGRALHQSTATP